MNIPPILAPAALLVLWTLIVLVWLGITRLRTFNKAGITIKNMRLGARMSDVEKEALPARASWVSNNYAHLMEQPTIYYAVVAILAIVGDTSQLSLAAAWGYFGFRVAHSIWQCCVNIVAVRVMLFALSTACLWILVIRAVRITL